jgi:RHS repeat-associated protein
MVKRVSPQVPAVSHYQADLLSATDYYPFGMTMAGRSFEVAGTYRYGFNGKEKEEGINIDNYDFGARIYDGRVGRWLSVDPMAYKNVPWSAYVFCGDNPISLVDPDGNDWVVSTTKDKDCSETTHIKLVVAVHNASNSKVDMNKFANALSSQVKNSYGITYTKTEYEKLTVKSGLDGIPDKITVVPKQVKVNVVVDVQVRVITSEDDLKSNEHLVQIQNASELPGVYGEANKIGGTKVSINASKVANMMNGKDNNTLVHELGHTFGLRHIDKGCASYDMIEEIILRT